MTPRFILLLSICSLSSLLQGAEITKKSAAVIAGNATQGKSEYQMMCAGCHDAGAAGPVLKGLFKHKMLHDKKRTPCSEKTVRGRITGGGEGMPPFVSLKTKQLDDLIAYLKTL